MGIDKLLEKIRLAPWNYETNKVADCGPRGPTFSGASGAAYNSGSENATYYTMSVKYGKRRIKVTLQESWYTPAHIRTCSSDAPKSILRTNWKADYIGLTKEEKEAVEEKLEEKVRKKLGRKDQ